MAYILIENFIRMGKFISFSLASYFSQRNLASVVFKDSLHGFAQRIVISWTRRAFFYVYYSGIEGAHEYRFCSSLLPLSTNIFKVTPHSCWE